MPKLKPGSGPKSRRSPDGALGVEDEDALVLDPDTMAPHALGAPAARLPEQPQQASQKSQISQQEEQADWAMAAESAPEFANLGRRLAPGSAPGPAGGLANLGCSKSPEFSHTALPLRRQPPLVCHGVVSPCIACTCTVNLVQAGELSARLFWKRCAEHVGLLDPGS